MGVGFVLRKTAAGLKPTVTITNDGEKWKISTVTAFKSGEVSFVDGVEFEEGFDYDYVFTNYFPY